MSERRFVVVARGPGGFAVRVPVTSAVVAALVHGALGREGFTAGCWQLRDDVDHPQPVLMFARGRAGGAVHAARLAPGVPGWAHRQACCGQPLRWGEVRVCDAGDGDPCPGCRGAVDGLGWVY